MNVVLIPAQMGIYGFLGGSTVEREGLPNAGLSDQRAAFDWVLKYIPEMGGNVNQITAIGLSAGAGSILHHLTAEGGTRNPLFQKAILQSAGYATVQDAPGEIERNFKRIEEICRVQR
jgi:carboxylesterase type B